MKRIALISGVIITLFLITFLFQNRFLLGVPFVQKDKTTWADLNRLLGKRYGPVYIKAASPGVVGRVYLMHYASYIFCDYVIEVTGDGVDVSKGRVDWIRWEKHMAWDKQHVLDFIDAEVAHH